MSIAVRAAGDLEQSLRRACAAVGDGARLVEWRLDDLAGSSRGVEAARALVRRSPAPSIVTCRSRAEGGSFDGDDVQRAELYETLLLDDHPPLYIDLELRAYLESASLRTRINEALDRRRDHDVQTSLILSVHDFDRRPTDLLQRIEAMTDEQRCAVIKVAWRARSLRDNLEALDVLAERRQPTIALCLGPFGLMSRVLASKPGGLLTYATDEAGRETAPGQPTVKALRSLYRIEAVSADTKVYGVIGWPVEQSGSPAIHNAGFGAIGWDGVYLPLPVPPEYEHFKATVSSFVEHRGLRFRGASVTIPHKQNLLRLVGERGGRIEPAASRIGAANTLIVHDDGTLECFNTDAPAAVATLCDAMGIEEVGLAGKRVAVLGAGGVARSVIGGLSYLGATVEVFNRTRRRAQALAEGFGGGPTAAGEPARVAVGAPGSLAGRFDVVVNCTPVGMAGGPAPQESPLPPDALLDASVTVFDTVYAPLRTPLIVAAEARGARTVTGRDMFLRQAAMQFERWTGSEAPVDVFDRALI